MNHRYTYCGICGAPGHGSRQCPLYRLEEIKQATAPVWSLRKSLAAKLSGKKPSARIVSNQMARMGQKCGNPNWGRRPSAVRSGITEFERLVAELGLKDEKAQIGSRKLREWVAKHRNSRYVPEELLSAYGLTVHVDVDGRRQRWSC